MTIILGGLYSNANGNGEIYWCDNYSGSLKLRHIESADVLNGVFNGPITPIEIDPASTNAMLHNETYLAQRLGSDDVYLIDRYDGQWKKRYISDMTVFDSRQFKQSCIETVRSPSLDGMFDGVEIDS